MKKLLFVLFLVLIVAALSSCFTAKSIHKIKTIPQPVDFEDSLTQSFFVLDRLYIIELLDERQYKFKVKKVHPSGIEGTLIFNYDSRKNTADSLIEIPFTKIADAKKLKFNPFLTLGIPLMGVVIYGVIGVSDIDFSGTFRASE